MRRIWPAIVAAIISGAILIGLFWIFWRHRHGIGYSLDFGSVLDAVVFLLVGAAVEYAYLKQSSDKRADTELLLEIVRDARTALETLAREARVCEGGKMLTANQRAAITFADRELSNAIYSIEEALRHCEANLDSLKFSALKDSLTELKESITDTPYPGPYDPSSIARMRTAFKNVRSGLTRIAFAINHR